MEYKPLDTVVIIRGIPAHDLRAGDLGAVVDAAEPDGLEVEFVTASGRTTALVSLLASDVRPIADSDLVAVRSIKRSA